MGNVERRKILLGLTLGTLALLTLGLGLFSSCSVAITETAVQPYRERGLPASATVLSIESRGGRSGARDISISYWTGSSLEGDLVWATVKVDGWTPGWQRVQEGDEVEILYLPEDPENKALPRSSLDRAAYPPLSRYEVMLTLLLGSALLFWLTRRLAPEVFTMDVKELEAAQKRQPS